MSVALWAEVVSAVIEQALPTETAAVAGVDAAKAPEPSNAPLCTIPERMVVATKMLVKILIFLLQVIRIS